MIIMNLTNVSNDFWPTHTCALVFYVTSSKAWVNTLLTFKKGTAHCYTG